MNYSQAIAELASHEARYPHRDTVRDTVSATRLLVGGVTRGMGERELRRGGIAVLSGAELEAATTRDKLITVASIVGIVTGVVWLAMVFTRSRSDSDQSTYGADTSDIAARLKSKGRDPYLYGL